MTISSADDPVAGPFEGNGVQTAFPFAFKVFAKTDLVVALSEDGEAETTLVLDSDYSVTLNADQDNNPGGTITYPVSGSPMPSGSTLTAESNLDAVQTTDIQNLGGFYPQVIEDALDRGVMLLKQASAGLRRSLRFPLSEFGVNTQLPAAASRALKTLTFDADGNPVCTTPAAGTADALAAALLAVTGSNMVGYQSDAAGAVYRKLQDRARERVSILDFASPGSIGDGENATAALTAAVAYAYDNNSNSNFKHEIFLPAGDYEFDYIVLNSLRGVNFVGEGSLDPLKKKTRWKFSGTGGTTAMLDIRSCAYLNFHNIIFDLNSVEGVDSVVLFTGNDANSVPPKNKFSNNWVAFHNCCFYAQPTLTTPPAQTVWVKSAAVTIFNKCSFYAGDVNALKLGADSDVDPDNGQPTFGDGRCVTAVLRECYFNGDIVRERAYQVHISGSQFYLQPRAGNVNSRLTLSGDGFVSGETLHNNSWDRTGVTSFSGTLIDGGSGVGSNGLRVINNQLDGRLRLVTVNRGSAVIEGNRGVANAGATGNQFVRIEANAGTVRIANNNDDDYVSANSSGTIRARLAVDLRTSQFLPILSKDNLGTATTLPAAGAWQGLLSADYKFSGQKVRISYSISIQHKDGGTTRAYTARVVVDGVSIAETQRRISLTAADEYGVIACSQVVDIDATDDLVTLELQCQQGSGAVFGIVQSTSTTPTGSGWTVELLES